MAQIVGTPARHRRAALFGAGLTRTAPPDGVDRGHVVGVTYVTRQPEAVLDGPQQAVVVELAAVGTGDGERAQDRADDVPTLAEAVLPGQAAGPLVFVVDDDDDPVAPERR